MKTILVFLFQKYRKILERFAIQFHQAFYYFWRVKWGVLLPKKVAIVKKSRDGKLYSKSLKKHFHEKKLLFFML